MAGRRSMFLPLTLLVLIAPLASSSIWVEEVPNGGFDAEGKWAPSVESDIHWKWWTHWSRDKDSNSIDDRLEWLIEQPEEVKRDWWRRAPEGHARIFVDYDHHPTDADISSLESLGVEVTFRFGYLNTVSAISPVSSILDENGIRSLSGVVMIEDLGLAETNMNEAVPNMAVDNVWNDFGLDGTGSVIAILDTGVRGDHEGLNDMDDDPFTCIDDPPDPDPLDPEPQPIPADCDPKIIAFFDAVFTDEEQDPSTSYDSGTHGTHVAGIAAGSGGGQTDPGTGERYVGAAPGAYLINILGCCDGDIEDVMQGAQWAIDNRDKYGIDIVTSSLGEQQFEVHIDNDGSSAWSRQMDMVVEAGIITTLSAGNEFGGATLAGCNTIDSPGDAELPVTVASLDKDLGLAIYSSRGYTSDLRVKPDVAVIGSNIMAPDAATQDGYTSKSGTSMATPLMAGIAALMVQANPDLTPIEFKDIISAHSIERDIQLLNDPGFNDCSLLETRPDNEFGFGQADPTAFVEAAGSIDRSLNVSMGVSTLQEIGNGSYVTGTSTGAAPGTGLVEIKVGGGLWSGAADLSKDGDWSSWSIKLDPHEKSGNSTIYARLVVSDDSISPVDARRVILVDAQFSGSSSSSGLTNLGPIAFFVPFLLAIALVLFVGRREEWLQNTTSQIDENHEDSASSIEPEEILSWSERLSRNLSELGKGGAITENPIKRVLTLCLLYFAQGLPQGFASVTFAAYLVANGVSVPEIAILFATVSLPWTFKWIWGPLVDSIYIEKYGPRRQWIVFAQTGMALTLGSLLLVPDLNGQIDLVARILFVHNIFSSLQDVATDALAVEVLEPDEVARVNGLMFAAKRVGIIFGGAVLGVLITKIGISGVIAAQLVMLAFIIMVPLLMVEKPGVQLFPWSRTTAVTYSLDSGTDSGALVAEVVDDSEEAPWEEEEEFRVARIVGHSIANKRVSISSFLAVSGVCIWLFGFVMDVFTVDWGFGKNVRIGFPALEAKQILGFDLRPWSGTNRISLALILLSVISLGRSRFISPQSEDAMPNPILLILAPIGALSNYLPGDGQFDPESVSKTVARTSFYLTKAFSVRSAFLLVVAGLLGELYYFTSPIYVDIFINEAGWSQQKYNGIVGGIALLGSVSGQIIGGILGDKFGIRRVAMVSFLVLALANATFAFLEPMWGNTLVMTIYLIGQYFIAGIALICIISLCMRLTWSKVGGTQFTAYMSILNTSVVFAYTLTERMISVFNYTSAIYIGAALTLVTTFFLLFIDENETDRVLEGRWEGDDEFDDLGESPWWDAEEGGEQPVASA